MVFSMIRATVFLLFILELDAAAANTVTSAKVLETEREREGEREKERDLLSFLCVHNRKIFSRETSS